ncbi:MAG: hypothetical protein JKY19_00430 [Alcanivoracaceae bacterium]|nr:hypothetical protein [Alcanivoracaceae bacterium]
MSFSLALKHAVGTMHFLAGFQKKGIKINCAYWILKDHLSIPEGLSFVQDSDNKAHYLLAVTKPMKISSLVEKLTWISHRMTLMKDLTLEAYKGA